MTGSRSHAPGQWKRNRFFTFSASVIQSANISPIPSVKTLVTTSVVIFLGSITMINIGKISVSPLNVDIAI